MAEFPTMLFADGILDATITHGVARITLAQTGLDGKPFPIGQLCVPLMQLPALTNGMVNLLRQVEAKAKEVKQQRQAGTAGGSTAAAPDAAVDALFSPPTGAFRFQS